MGPHALIVEDEEPFRGVVGEILQGAGYEVTLCESGARAIELALRPPPRPRCRPPRPRSPIGIG